MLVNLPNVLGFIVIGAPALLALVLGGTSLVGQPLSERATGRLAHLTTFAGLLAAIAMLAFMLQSGSRQVPVELGDWVEVGHVGNDHSVGHASDGVETGHYHFSLKLMFDRLSVPFVILIFVLCGTIGAFATRYLHREPGFNRFFVLYAFFALGMTLASLAGTIETLFTGWEIVGVTSALLVAFFQERPAPVRNGLRVWAVYRISDAALLVAAIAMHHMVGQGDFATLMGNQAWPQGAVQLSQQQALLIGLLLVVAAAGKSALIPFCGWLPRAMEGPTPSSAIFYGSLSVHLGVFLLLRMSPIIESSLVLQIVIVAIGLATAAFAALASRVQTDIKSALSFAALTQVGVIVAEIGLGLHYLALAHMIGHACLRTLQFLRASSLLQDYRSLENAIGGRLSPQLTTTAPSDWQLRLYLFATNRGYLDAFLNDWVARPFLAVFQTCDALERRWTTLLAGGHSRESDSLAPVPSQLDELQ